MPPSVAPPAAGTVASRLAFVPSALGPSTGSIPLPRSSAAASSMSGRLLSRLVVSMPTSLVIQSIVAADGTAQLPADMHSPERADQAAGCASTAPECVIHDRNLQRD